MQIFLGSLFHKIISWKFRCNDAGLRKTNVCCAAAEVSRATQVPRATALYCLLTQAGPSLMVQEKQMPPTASQTTADSDSPRSRALLPADAGGIFVNGLRKTNVCCAAACFSLRSLYIIRWKITTYVGWGVLTKGP